MQKNSPVPLSDHLIMTLVIMVSGSPVFIASGRTEIFLVIVFGISFYFGLTRSRLISKDLMLFIALSSIILIYQAVSLDFHSVETTIGFYMRIVIGFLAFNSLRRAPFVYVKIIYWSAIVSLVIFSLSEFLFLFRVSLKEVLRPVGEIFGPAGDIHVLVYNFDGKGELHRNSSYFWEPGAFAGYLVLAIILLAGLRDVLTKKKYYLMLFVLVLSVLSTKSTMGYLVLPLALLAHYRFTIKNGGEGVRSIFFSIAAVLIFIPAAMYVAKLNFIGDKIEAQLEQAILEQDNWQVNRFGNMIYDWNYIQQRPFFGWGPNEKTRYALEGGEVISGQGNGFTGITVKLGLVGLLLYIFFLHKGLSRFFSGQFLKPALAVVALLLSLNSETFLNFPVFWGLMFLKDSKAI